MLLNPSTADADKDDHTLRRCVGFARAWGAGSLEVVNLFALVATRPAALLDHTDPAGRQNARALRRALTRADLVVAGWGNMPAELLDVSTPVMRALPGRAWCLGLTAGGNPRHPLYLAAGTALRPFETPR